MTQQREAVLEYERTLIFRNGSFLKSYLIHQPYTAQDCLRRINENPHVVIGHGKREGEHDVGCGSSADYDDYRDAADFLASGDYTRYAGDDYISRYSFYGTCKGDHDPFLQQ